MKALLFLIAMRLATAIAFAGEAPSFDRVQGLKVGVSKTDDAKRMLGEPSQVATLADKSTAWIYRDANGGLEKATLSFSADGVLRDKVLMVSENDSERDVAGLLKQFAGADFKKEKIIQDFGHFFTSRVCLVDKKRGISIALSEDEKTAVSINWYDPAVRSVAKTKGPASKAFRDSATGLVTKVPADVRQID